jgi:hypothetical protein
VTVNFNEQVNAVGNAFTLECPTGTPKTFTVMPVPPASSYTLTPDSNLPAGTVCTVTVKAAQVTDNFGFHPSADYTFSFTTDNPPHVISTTPANNAMNVPTNSTITINFDKPVYVTSSNAFVLQCPSPVPFTVSPNPPGPSSSWVLTPNSSLPGNATCQSGVIANQVTDTVGTHPSMNYGFIFQTAP